MDEQMKKSECDGKLYTIKPGDTLYEIAKRYNINVENILKANPQITNPAQINVGQVICIPDTPSVLEKCAIVLEVLGETDINISRLTGGVVLIQRIDNNYALTFAATGLPDPEIIGEFNTYIGSININGQQYSAVLNESAPLEQESTWCGTRIIPENPFDFPQSSVTIVPFNLETDTRTNPILGGNIKNCKA